MDTMETEDISTAVTQDERIMAALAHAGVILPFWGLIGAIVIWATQREKSRFVGFQALQVLAYQLALVLTGALGFACYICSIFGTVFGAFLLIPLGLVASEGAAEGAPGAEGIIGMLLTMVTTFFPFCVMGLFVLVGIAFVVYGLYGAMRVLQGQDFRYAIVGRWLERYLNREQMAT